MEAQPVFDAAGVQIAKRWAMTQIWFDPVRKYRTVFE